MHTYRPPPKDSPFKLLNSKLVLKSSGGLYPRPYCVPVSRMHPDSVILFIDYPLQSACGGFDIPFGLNSSQAVPI